MFPGKACAPEFEGSQARRFRREIGNDTTRLTNLTIFPIRRRQRLDARVLGLREHSHNAVKIQRVMLSKLLGAVVFPISEGEELHQEVAKSLR